VQCQWGPKAVSHLPVIPLQQSWKGDIPIFTADQGYSFVCLIKFTASTNQAKVFPVFIRFLVFHYFLYLVEALIFVGRIGKNPMASNPKRCGTWCLDAVTAFRALWKRMGYTMPSIIESYGMHNLYIYIHIYIICVYRYSPLYIYININNWYTSIPSIQMNKHRYHSIPWMIGTFQSSIWCMSSQSLQPRISV
jgi:hypothetical protein